MRVKPLTAVLVLALLIRVGVLFIVPDSLAADPDDYLRLAENVVEHDTFGHGDVPTAYRPPLYPLMLTGCVAEGDYTRTAIGVLHLLLGLATVAMVFMLGNRWGLSRRGAMLAAMLVACDPILLFQSTRIMTETAATFFAVLGLAALTYAFGSLLKKGATAGLSSSAANKFGKNTAGQASSGTRIAVIFIAGAVLALGALCRPTTLVWIAAVGVVLIVQAWLCRRRLLTPIESVDKSATGVASYKLPIAFVLGVAIVLSPWVIRNQLQFGRPIAATTHGGYTLLLANNPEFYEWLRSGRWGDVWQGDEFNAQWDERRPNGELAADRLAYDEAWRTIRSEPGTFVYSCFVRLGRLWSPLPHRLATDESPARRSSRYAVAAWYVLEYLLAAIGVWRIARFRPAPGTSVVAQRFNNTWLWGLLLVLSLSCVHTIYWADMRMRAVVMPVIALAAAAGALRRDEP